MNDPAAFGVGGKGLDRWEGGGNDFFLLQMEIKLKCMVDLLSFLEATLKTNFLQNLYLKLLDRSDYYCEQQTVLFDNLFTKVVHSSV